MRGDRRPQLLRSRVTTCGSSQANETTRPGNNPPTLSLHLSQSQLPFLPPLASTFTRSSSNTAMQIYGLLIFANPPGAQAVPLTTAWELGSFGWLQRGTVQDMMGFMAKVS